MLSVRYIIRLIQAFILRFKAIIVTSVGVGIIFFITLNFLLPGITSTSYKIGEVGKYTITNLPDEITNKISRGLTKIEIDGNVVPDIAESWETSDNGKTWIFKIKNDLIWQDDKKLKLDDLNYEFSDATTEVISNNEIKFSLQSNYSAFPVIVSKPIFKKGLLGLGEYKVTDVSLVGGFVQKLTIKNKNGQKIIYKFYPSEERLKLAFKLGEVEKIEGLQDIKEFEKWKTVKIDKNTEYNNFVALFFNTQNDKFKDKSVRQALAYAIDKENLGNVRSIGPISPYSWAYNPQVKKYLKDIEKAKDVKGIYVKISTLPNLLSTAENIANQWKEIGVVVDIEVTATIPQEFDVFLATVDIPKDPDQYSLWHSTQEGTNISNYKNARIDKLLEDGRTELDREVRKKIYLDFQRFLVEDVPAIFLYHPSYYSVSRK